MVYFGLATRNTAHANEPRARTFESQQLSTMSLESSPEPRRSPKRKRSNSRGYDATGDPALAYAYDDELTSDADNQFQTPDQGSEDEQGNGSGAKRRKIERPTRLNYVPHMTLRGHKRGVAAVKFSPDGKWIASCCEAHWSQDDNGTSTD
jgi:COMPASS component SWD3